MDNSVNYERIYFNFINAFQFEIEFYFTRIDIQ